MSEVNNNTGSGDQGGVVIVQICVGSSCHLKGSQQVVEKMQSLISEYKVEDQVVLTGCFCAERCNRVGVTITVDDDVYEGVTPFETEAFFKEHILSRVSQGGA